MRYAELSREEFWGDRTQRSKKKKFRGHNFFPPESSQKETGMYKARYHANRLDLEPEEIWYNFSRTKVRKISH